VLSLFVTDYMNGYLAARGQIDDAPMPYLMDGKYVAFILFYLFICFRHYNRLIFDRTY